MNTSLSPVLICAWAIAVAPVSTHAADPSSRSYLRTDKIDRVWLAEGFDFTGYDALLIEPTQVVPEVKPKDEKESERLDFAKASLPKDLALAVESRGLFKTIGTRDSDLPAGARSLRLRMTILKFSRGSSSARYGIGFGAGMPYIQVRVQVRETAGDREVFFCELDEKADWLSSGYTGSKTLQAGASMELCDDLATFINRVAKHEKIKYKPAK